MRLRQLELLRYGKFSDTLLEFPRAESDFHVIVGPNEAGKSTVRAAVQELLFGMRSQICALALSSRTPTANSSHFSYAAPLPEAAIDPLRPYDPGFQFSGFRTFLTTPEAE